MKQDNRLVLKGFLRGSELLFRFALQQPETCIGHA